VATRFLAAFVISHSLTEKMDWVEPIAAKTSSLRKLTIRQRELQRRRGERRVMVAGEAVDGGVVS
jgi:hypothetical protein